MSLSLRLSIKFDKLLTIKTHNFRCDEKKERDNWEIIWELDICQVLAVNGIIVTV